jgi:hypothetical protein
MNFLAANVSTAMDSKHHDHLETHIKLRQQTLWDAIVKVYAVDQITYKKVSDWIAEGNVSEKAFNLRGARKPNTPLRTMVG